MKTLGRLLRMASWLSGLWRLTPATLPVMPAREPARPTPTPDLPAHANCRCALATATAIPANAARTAAMPPALHWDTGPARDRREALLLRALQAEAPRWLAHVPLAVYVVETRRIVGAMADQQAETATIPGYDILGTIPTHWLPHEWN